MGLAVVLAEAVPLMLLAVRVKVQGPDPVTLILPPEAMAVGPVGAPVLDEV